MHWRGYRCVTKDALATLCARALISGWISRFGACENITSDRGRQFASELWSSLTNFLEWTIIERRLITPVPMEWSKGFIGKLKASLKLKAQYWTLGRWATNRYARRVSGCERWCGLFTGRIGLLNDTAVAWTVFQIGYYFGSSLRISQKAARDNEGCTTETTTGENHMFQKVS